MKTLTTLVAAVTLIAGVSVANAAGTSSMGKSSTTGASSTMSKGSMSKSARVIGKNKYCVKLKSGTLNCKFASLSSCRSRSKGEACMSNPHISTTGSGGSMKK